VDGLGHVSQVSDRRVQHVREVLSPGQAVEAVILTVEPERKRISLSLKTADADIAAVPPSRVTRSERPRTGPARSGRGEGQGQGASAGRSRPPGRKPERSTESEAWRPPPPPVDDSPTLMQLAFRRAREAAERREAKGK
jgi:transcriptional accessory protein Tex/SPT6